MAEKSSFVLYDRYYEQINMLSDEQAGQLFKAIYAHRSGEEIVISDPAVAILWSVIRQQMDIDDRKYQEVCDKRKSAGQKGGRPAKTANGSEEKQNEASQPKDLTEDSKETNGYFEKQTKANKPNAFLGFENNPDNDIDIECDIDNDNDNNTNPISPQGESDWHERFSPAMGEKLDEWLAYKAEKRQKYKPQGLKTLLSKTEKEIAKYGEEAVMDVIDSSMSSGYQGIVWDRLAGSHAGTKTAGYAGAKTSGGPSKPDDGLDDLLAQMYQRGWE